MCMCVHVCCVCGHAVRHQLTNTLNTIILRQRREKETGGTSEGMLSGLCLCVYVHVRLCLCVSA